MAAETKVLATDDLDRWRAYFDRLDAGPYHSPEYLSFLAGRLERETDARLFVLDDGDAFVYYPYLVRPVATLPFADRLDLDPGAYDDIIASWYYGGPLVSDPDADLAGRFASRFRDHCADHGIVAEFVRFDPNERNHERFPDLDPAFNRETVWVDLSQSDEELWDGFEKRNRNAIRQAQDTDLVVEPASDPADRAAFHDIYSNAMEAKGATGQYRFPRSFFDDLLSKPDLATLLVARHGDDVVGGSVLVHDDTIAHDYLRASNPDYWDLRVNNLLCYEALVHMRETGRERFDFQGGRPGVFKFKKSFSPDRGEFHVAKRVHLPGVYDQLVAAADAAGIDTDSGYFPAYRVEQSN